jgi:L,D-peptidoglycan transpeptidase YkuD (ErfK/YbiS/YcfS/YnhG family)
MKAAAIALAVALSGCSVTQPVAVVSKTGIMRGSATASMSGGQFQVADEHGTCGGTYDPMSGAETISAKVTCSDGRRGIAIITREGDGQSGHGNVRLDDGTEASLIFGPAAEAF